MSRSSRHRGNVYLMTTYKRSKNSFIKSWDQSGRYEVSKRIVALLLTFGYHVKTNRFQFQGSSPPRHSTCLTTTGQRSQGVLEYVTWFTADAQTPIAASLGHWYGNSTFLVVGRFLEGLREKSRGRPDVGNGRWVNQWLRSDQTIWIMTKCLECTVV